MSDFRTILVANRGEIACRVMRTAKAMGYRTAAVYSEADAEALHVRMADIAACIGPPEARASYLNVDAILAAAKRVGAEAVHPGYGFLSENADFARACAEAGLVFIGPPADAIAAMGNKAEAKRRMAEAGVPCVPGYQGSDQSDARLIDEAERIGFPVMVKAAAGGGGRGMRLVSDRGELAAALARARAEAESAFGSGELILEKAIARGPPRGNPGPRRCARQRHPSRRARLLGAAPPPEGDRGGAVSRGEPGIARAHGRCRRRCRQGHRLHQCRHGRVPARRRRRVLFPGDEHAPAGGAPGHRAGHGARPGRAADPHRQGRAPADPAGGRSLRRPRHRGAALCRGAAQGVPAPIGAARRLASPPAPASASITGSARARRSAPTTTRCLPS